jgi:hypothetical protein
MPQKLAPLVNSLDKLFTTPSLMKGEDPRVYAELHALVEEVAHPKDVWDQMMVCDIANHFWEQQRGRRCTGAVVNSKRRAALLTILHEGIGLNPHDAGEVADIYFNVTRSDEFDFADWYAGAAQIPQTRPAVLAFLEEHGFDETEIDRLAMEASVDALARLESLALKHEIRREEIFRELERRRSRREQQRQSMANRQINGGVQTLAKRRLDEASTSRDELP